MLTLFCLVIIGPVTPQAQAVLPFGELPAASFPSLSSATPVLPESEPVNVRPDEDRAKLSGDAEDIPFDPSDYSDAVAKWLIERRSQTCSAERNWRNVPRDPKDSEALPQDVIGVLQERGFFNLMKNFGKGLLHCATLGTLGTDKDDKKSWDEMTTWQKVKVSYKEIGHALTFGILREGKPNKPRKGDPLSYNWSHEETSRGDEAQCSDKAKKDDPPSIPNYVFEYAPLVWLYSGENYWPVTLEVHLQNTEAYFNYEPVPEEERHPTSDHMSYLNSYGRHAYTQSLDDPEDYPWWMAGEENIPDDDGFTEAHAFLFTVDKGKYLDAFWFFFYSFNLGNQVLGIRFGNHVGDWEHTAIRFDKSTGKPTTVFYSEHEWGKAHLWKDIERHNNGKRMYTYSATGTHAMYPTAGVHRYVLPFGLLQDITDRGSLWDPLQNLRAYVYDIGVDEVYPIEAPPSKSASQSNRNFTSSSSSSNFSMLANHPSDWFHYIGHWGDKKYLIDDPRQYMFAGELHYVSGPTGPKDKHLDREYICQNPGRCEVEGEPESGFSERVISLEEWESYRRMREDGESRHRLSKK